MSSPKLQPRNTIAIRLEPAGANEAAKDRPCAIVVAARRERHGEIRVIVAPITHAPPTDNEASIEIPAAVCRKLGLDDGRHWLRADELNRFAWPGYDLRPVPGSKTRYSYGMLPVESFERLRRRILERQQTRQALHAQMRD